MMTSNHGFVYPSLARSFARSRARVGKGEEGSAERSVKRECCMGCRGHGHYQPCDDEGSDSRFKNYELRVKSRRVDLFTSIARSSYVTGKREKHADPIILFTPTLLVV